MICIVTFKSEEDPSKNEGTRVVRTFLSLKSLSMGNFTDAQGQLTPKSFVRSCRISNPFKILWLSLLKYQSIRIFS